MDLEAKAREYSIALGTNITAQDVKDLYESEGAITPDMTTEEMVDSLTQYESPDFYNDISGWKDTMDSLNFARDSMQYHREMGKVPPSIDIDAIDKALEQSINNLGAMSFNMTIPDMGYMNANAGIMNPENFSRGFVSSNPYSYTNRTEAFDIARTANAVNPAPSQISFEDNMANVPMSGPFNASSPFTGGMFDPSGFEGITSRNGDGMFSQGSSFGSSWGRDYSWDGGYSNKGGFDSPSEGGSRFGGGGLSPDRGGDSPSEGGSRFGGSGLGSARGGNEGSYDSKDSGFGGTSSTGTRGGNEGSYGSKDSGLGGTSSTSGSNSGSNSTGVGGYTADGYSNDSSFGGPR